MNDLYQNKYRIPSARLQNWDYSWAAAYFVTLCTKNRAHYFGDIVNEKLQLTPMGAIADVLWFEIKNHARNIELDTFVVMPNHIHGIVILNNDEMNGNDDGIDNNNNGDGDMNNGDNIDNGGNNGNNVETRHALSLPPPQSSPLSIGQKRFQNQGKNTLSSIIGSYKSAVTKHANRLGLDFEWQSRFHEHIIRDNTSYERIRNYIIDNPSNWNNDKFYNKNDI
jgi:REP element-mobilizing transposase RayT